MKSISSLRIFTIGLALFSMLFGAGNIMYPIKVGMDSGEFTLLGYLSFCITAVLLPLAGIIGIILFHGDYVQFFKRLGDWPGELLLAISLFLLGPIIAIPRLVTLCHIYCLHHLFPGTFYMTQPVFCHASYLHCSF